MPRFTLTIEYAGTRYSGWQIQANARTVQGEIERAVRAASGATTFELYGAGRTDAGVHALGQVAHLQLDARTEPERLRQLINDELPADINILALARSPQRFHARHDAVARAYLYQISRRRTAFAKPYVWWVREDLDVAAMREAAAAFTGRHDFRGFTQADAGETSTTVEVERVEVAEHGPLVLIRVRGSHFLWRMVRRLVGVMTAAGRGDFGPDHVRRLLREPSDAPARLTAPASGLFLERVFYAGEERDAPLRPAVFSAC